MTHIERRNERMQLLMKIVGSSGLIKHDVLAAQLSFHTGCSMSKAFEYIKTAVLAEQLKISDGYIELNNTKKPAPDSA